MNAPSPLIPIPRGPVPEAPRLRPRATVEIEIDGQAVSVPEGSTILDATGTLGIDTPTLCFLETLTPVNVCRVCVVELEGSRTLVPACSRRVQNGMAIQTDSERVRLSRRVVLEFLASSVDVSTAPALQGYLERYGGRPERFGSCATVAQPPTIDTNFTCGITGNASCATSAWRLAAWMRRILSLLGLRGVGFRRTSRRSLTCRCRNRLLCIAGTASRFVLRAR
jgi:hypothetical protein